VTAADVRRRLRARAEHVLLQAAMEELRREHPAGTTAPYHHRRDLAWRRLFVPLYRRIPWDAKVRAMHALGMTAERHGWTPPPRRPGVAWRPPAPTAGPGDGAGGARTP